MREFQLLDVLYEYIVDEILIESQMGSGNRVIGQGG